MAQAAVTVGEQSVLEGTGTSPGSNSPRDGFFCCLLPLPWLDSCLRCLSAFSALPSVRWGQPPLEHLQCQPCTLPSGPR